MMLLKKLKSSFLYLMVLSFLSTPALVGSSFNDAGSVFAADAQPKTSSLMPNKKEKKHVLNKFMLSMMWVCGSCVVILGSLLLYKRFKTGREDEKTGNEPDISQNLISPVTIDEAAEFVIKKF